MSVLPLKPWINKTRNAILWVGFGWPVVIYLINYSADQRSIDFTIIGAMFLTTIFVPVAFVVALFMPTYQLRIFGVPLALILVFWWVSSQSATYKGFNLPPPMMLWIVTFTAITLLIPQLSSVVAFVERLFRRNA
ncbi:MAG: hypothetical protein V4602_03385 [Pseudomonadota bacterium]